MSSPRRLGILGGGQLARMLSVAASRLGIETHVYSDEPNAPAQAVCAAFTAAGYDDGDALDRFGRSVDVVTYEFENLPVEAVHRLQKLCPVRPGHLPLAVCQDRMAEKGWLNGLGLQTVQWAAVSSEEDLHRAVESVGLPALLKTRLMGYDGKGQVLITESDQVAEAWEALQGQESVLEQFVDLDHEISVIAARNETGEVACFDPGANTHSGGILRTTRVPAGTPAELLRLARDAAGTVLEAFDYVGVVGIEFFVTRDGRLLVNEMAPRVHNSGHWTQNGCTVDQFEQHVRAVMGLPLGSGERHADVVMTNLIGPDILELDRWLRQPGAAVHVYGKHEMRDGRKMGHVNQVTALPDPLRGSTMDR